MEEYVAGKPKPVIIEAKNFPTFLAGRMAGLKLKAADLAEELEISPAAVYTLLTGELPPNDKILEKLGLRPVFILEVQQGPIEQAAKPKGKK
jgi:hypothetical protein